MNFQCSRRLWFRRNHIYSAAFPLLERNDRTPRHPCTISPSRWSPPGRRHCRRNSCCCCDDNSDRSRTRNFDSGFSGCSARKDTREGHYRPEISPMARPISIIANYLWPLQNTTYKRMWGEQKYWMWVEGENLRRGKASMIVDKHSKMCYMKRFFFESWKYAGEPLCEALVYHSHKIECTYFLSRILTFFFTILIFEAFERHNNGTTNRIIWYQLDFIFYFIFSHMKISHTVCSAWILIWVEKFQFKLHFSLSWTRKVPTRWGLREFKSGSKGEWLWNEKLFKCFLMNIFTSIEFFFQNREKSGNFFLCLNT